VTVTIKWKDNATTKSRTVGPVALATLGATASATIEIDNDGSQAITYNTTHTGVFGTATYALDVIAERLA